MTARTPHCGGGGDAHPMSMMPSPERTRSHCRWGAPPCNTSGPPSHIGMPGRVRARSEDAGGCAAPPAPGGAIPSSNVRSRSDVEESLEGSGLVCSTRWTSTAGATGATEREAGRTAERAAATSGRGNRRRSHGWDPTGVITRRSGSRRPRPPDPASRRRRGSSPSNGLDAGRPTRGRRPCPDRGAEPGQRIQ